MPASALCAKGCFSRSLPKKQISEFSMSLWEQRRVNTKRGRTTPGMSSKQPRAGPLQPIIHYSWETTRRSREECPGRRHMLTALWLLGVKGNSKPLKSQGEVSQRQRSLNCYPDELSHLTFFKNTRTDGLWFLSCLTLLNQVTMILSVYWTPTMCCMEKDSPTKIGSWLSREFGD